VAEDRHSPAAALPQGDACATMSSVAQGGRIYSVGYEGFPAPALVDRLAANKVTTLVDVRLTPSSRKPGYSRKSLSAALEMAGITYIHEPELGNPPDNRDSFRRGNGQEGREHMRARLMNGSGPALVRTVERARQERIAVLCVERERHRCHRDVITDMALELAPELEVVHIL
jgi:uncharacterized protein (DUF488 family)